MSNRPEQRRLQGDGGATLVEYVLVVALVVGGSLGAIGVLNDAASDQVDMQADCVSTRPPPPGCQVRPVITTTTTVAPTTTVTTAPTTTVPTTTTPTTAPPPPHQATWTGSSTWVDQPAGFWRASGTIVVRDAATQPVAGAVVWVRWQITNPTSTETFTGSCTTDVAGMCTISFEPPFSNVVTVLGTVLRVDSDRPVSPLPSPLTFTRPA